MDKIYEASLDLAAKRPHQSQPDGGSCCGEKREIVGRGSLKAALPMPKYALNEAVAGWGNHGVTLEPVPLWAYWPRTGAIIDAGISRW